jgi:hypothetical protein
MLSTLFVRCRSEGASLQAAHAEPAGGFARRVLGSELGL